MTRSRVEVALAALSTRAPVVTRGDQLRNTGLVLSRLFCIAAGGFLFADTLAALLFTDFDLSVGDNLPHETWTFVFAFNTWHHLLHLATSSLLLVTALRRRWAPVGALLFGAIYAILAPAGWIDGNDAFNLFYGSVRENVVHTLLALQGVAFGWLGLAALARERRLARS